MRPAQSVARLAHASHPVTASLRSLIVNAEKALKRSLRALSCQRIAMRATLRPANRGG
jgi:hypothetical protein